VICDSLVENIYSITCKGRTYSLEGFHVRHWNEEDESTGKTLITGTPSFQGPMSVQQCRGHMSSFFGLVVVNHDILSYKCRTLNTGWLTLRNATLIKLTLREVR